MLIDHIVDLVLMRDMNNFDRTKCVLVKVFTEFLKHDNKALRKSYDQLVSTRLCKDLLQNLLLIGTAIRI